MTNVCSIETIDWISQDSFDKEYEIQAENSSFVVSDTELDEYVLHNADMNMLLSGSDSCADSVTFSGAES